MPNIRNCLRKSRKIQRSFIEYQGYGHLRILLSVAEPIL